MTAKGAWCPGLRRLASVLLAFLCGSFPLAAQDAVLEGFHGYLLNSKTGRLSGDVLAGDQPPLTNAVAGEYSSTSTLVTVRLRIVSRAALKSGKIRLVATEEAAPFSAAPPRQARVILDKVSALGTPGEDGITFVGFWLADTGCKPITLRATLTGAGAAKPLAGQLPFVCHE